MIIQANNVFATALFIIITEQFEQETLFRITSLANPEDRCVRSSSITCFSLSTDNLLVSAIHTLASFERPAVVDLPKKIDLLEFETLTIAASGSTQSRTRNN